MTVVVRGDSLSSKDELHLGPVLHAVHLQKGRLLSGSKVSRQQGSSMYRVLGEMPVVNSEQGSNLTVQSVGTAQVAPESISWSTAEGSAGQNSLNVAEASQISRSNMLGGVYRVQDRNRYSESTSVTLPYADSRWLVRIAEKEDAIVTVMRLCGLTAIADRLNHLRALIAEDPDEPDLVLESLRSFADFFLCDDRLPVPEVGVGPEGFLEAEWRIPAKREASVFAPLVRWVRPDERYWGKGDGILAMKFLPSGSIQYAAVSEPVGQGKVRLRSSGVYSKDSIMPAIQAFTSRLGLP